MNKTVKRTQYLTEAAAAVAIASILVLLKLILPFLVFITMIAAPAPLAIITAQHGMKWGLGSSLAVILVVTILGGPEIGLTTAVYAGALGLALGYGTRRQWTAGKIIVLTALAYVVEMTYKIVFSIYVLGISDALSSVLTRLITFMQWIWRPLSSVLGYDPNPERAMFSTAGAAMLAVIFIIDSFCYAYLAEELFSELYRRIRKARH